MFKYHTATDDRAYGTDEAGRQAGLCGSVNLDQEVQWLPDQIEWLLAGKHCRNCWTRSVSADRSCSPLAPLSGATMWRCRTTSGLVPRLSRLGGKLGTHQNRRAALPMPTRVTRLHVCFLGTAIPS